MIKKKGEIQNFCLNIFQENPIQLETHIFNIDSFICSLNYSQLGVYTHYFNRSSGKIIMYFQKETQWVEYLIREIQSSNPIQLLCFTNNNQQLLFHREKANSIESLNVNQNAMLKHSSYLPDTVEMFFQFTVVPYSMLASNDQAKILIKTKRKVFLLDVIQKIIILTFNDQEELQYQNINFFDETYLIQTQILKFELLISEKKMFYNIKNKKVQKILYLRKTIHHSQQNSLAEIKQLNNCKSLGILYFESIGNFTILILNIINLKFIKKIQIQENSNLDYYLEFLGCNKRYLLYRFHNNGQNWLHITDLTNFEVQKFDLTNEPVGYEMFRSFFYKKQIYIYSNQVLMVEDYNRQKIQFWLTK